MPSASRVDSRPSDTQPARSRARRRASSGDRPRRSPASTSMSRWNCSSSRALGRQPLAPQHRRHAPDPSRACRLLQHPRHDARHPQPLGALLVELPAAAGGELVEAGAPVRLGLRPPRRDPAARLEAHEPRDRACPCSAAGRRRTPARAAPRWRSRAAARALASVCRIIRSSVPCRTPGARLHLPFEWSMAGVSIRLSNAVPGCTGARVRRVLVRQVLVLGAGARCSVFRPPLPACGERVGVRGYCCGATTQRPIDAATRRATAAPRRSISDRSL